MRNLQKEIILIVPCFNEQERLSINLSAFISSPYRFVFVNDGSTDSTIQILENEVKPPNYYISIPSNKGKGEAVRKGIEFAKTLKEYNEAEWVGYWDADLAAPLNEINSMLEYAELSGSADAVYCSRIMRFGSVIKRRLFRHILGRVYCTIISMLFGIQCYDTQCGAKLFKKSVIDKAFAEPFLSRWIFDVEIILRLKDFRQLEYPIRKWEDVKGSKISPFNSIFSVSLDVLRIFLRYR